MSSTPEREWLEERAQPFYMTVWRAGHVWQVSIYRAGFTMAERLNPDCVTTVSIPEDRARLLGTNRELLREVVSMAMDLSDGIVGARTV